jgi:mono/diheme cytochrome c family protein
LLAYLESLGRARELAGPEGEAHAREACNCADDEMLQMAFDGPVNAHPAKTRRRGGVPALPSSSNAARGQALYGDHCASCHGPTGAGDGPGAASLRPRPGNLAEHEYSDRRLAEALWHGVAGTAMPAWRDYPLTDLAALTARVRALAAPREEPALPAHLTDIGARVYAANCAQCHGVDGDGRGSAADALPMAPTNFHTQRPTLDHSLRILRNGVDGTPMAPWNGRLGVDEMLAVAHFVRAFYEEGSR